MINALPAESATVADMQLKPAPPPPAPPRVTSSPEAIRRAGGKVILVPKGGG